MIASGQTLLHYRILDKIGEGGMGAVYKAEDTHLDRFVAIKVLPHDRMADPDRRQRFVQEAKAASALHHPNIVVVHDIAADAGLDFIVMEYVEGRTLDQLIGRKGLKLNEALGYAAQIADGLAKAHASGIVHRDLKPTNVMVTPDGRIKVLDFGLAKLVEGGPAGDLGPTATLGRPERPRTEEGYILGTVSYMSPEQAEGRPVDARSDIFSFGAVLYEMLTGQRAFHGESRIATLAAILNEDPKPAGEINAALPPDVGSLLARCLRKDPQRRWQSMSDLRVVLQDLKEDSESGRLRRPEAAARARRFPAAVRIGLPAALLVISGLLWVLRPRDRGLVEYEITRLTFDPGISGAPAFSPDGKMFVYASDKGGHSNIWLQQVAGGAPLKLTNDSATVNFPSFSPDGGKVVFNTLGGGIFEIGLLGGGIRRLAGEGLRPRYSPDGSLIAYVVAPASPNPEQVKIRLLPAKGGEPATFLPEFCLNDIATGGGPVWSPDGRYILFNGRRVDDPATLDWWAAPVSGGRPIRTGAHASLELPTVWQSPAAWLGSYVYYSTGTTVEGVNIYRARIDPKTFQVSGPPEPVTSGSGIQFQLSALPDGRLIYGNGTWVARLLTVEARPDEGLITGPPVFLSQDLTAKFSPALSRDGSKLIYGAFGGLRTNLYEVHVRDLGRGEEKVIPIETSEFNQDPQISADGSVISYTDFQRGSRRTFVMGPQDTAGREVCDSCDIRGFYADPRFVLVAEERKRFLRLDVSTGQRTLALEAQEGLVSAPALSADDRWIAFVLAKPDGRVAIVIASLASGPPDAKDWIVLFEESRYAGSPAFSPNGRLLFYVSERDGPCKVWCQPLDPLTKKPAGDPRIVFDGRPLKLDLNMPRGNGTVSVGRDKLAIWAGEMTGNVYMAAPRRKK